MAVGSVITLIMGVIARQSIKGTLATYAGVVIGFISTFFVVTRYLTTEEVGLTRVMVDATMLFASLSLLANNSTMQRFFPYFRSSRLAHHGVFGLSVLVPLVGFVLFLALFLIFKGTLMTVYGQRSALLTDYFYVLPMMTFFVLYMLVFETNSILLMRLSVPKAVREVGVKLMNLVSYLLYGYGVVSLDVFVWLFCGSYAVAMVLNVVYVMAIGSKDVEGGVAAMFKVDWAFLRDGALWREMLRFSLFMLAGMLATNMPLFGSLFLGAKVGLATTGVYTIAFYIANVVDVPYRSLGAIAQPVLSAAIKEGDWDEAKRMAKQVSVHQFLASTMVLYLIWINLDTLFAVIPNGGDYVGGMSVVLILGLSRVICSTSNVSADLLNYSRYYSRMLFFSLFLTVMALVMNNKLIGLWGMNGAAAATLITYAMYYALLLTEVWVKLKVFPYSMRHLKVAVILAALVVLNLLWARVVAPLFGTEVVGLLADSVVKTVVLALAALAAVYGWKVSPSINDIVDRVLKRRKA